jgi:hypothetical protein
MPDMSRRLNALSDQQRAQLARLLLERKRRGQASSSIQRRPPGTDTVPCSWMQRGIWIHEQLQPGTAYTIMSAIRMRGALDLTVFERALNEVVRRHEILRTTFHHEDGDPVQRVAAALTIPLVIENLTGLSPHARDAEAERLTDRLRRQRFDLERGPLLRPILLQLGHEDYRLLMVVHHIVADAWALGQLFDEILTLYRAFVTGEPSPLPELPIQYADFSAWQRSTANQQVLEDDLAYWKSQLANVVSTELTTDMPRPATRRFRGTKLRFQILPDLIERLNAVSRREGVSLYMVLLGAFQALLHRYTGEEDIVVGSPMLDRRQGETQNLIGFFLNTLVMRADLTGDPSFRVLLQQVRQTALEAFDHLTLPFDQLVRELQPIRDTSRTPLFQVMFTYEYHASLSTTELPGLQLQGEPVEAGTTQFDLSMILEQVEDTINAILEYDTDLFRPDTAERLAEHFEVLLSGIAENPDRRISELPLLTQSERQHVST